ncbi:MAG: hypothetical protein IJY39_09730 [Clostridia bacterium]|nr:hypothetical protein [Clostridia bacterium]
MRFVLTEVVEGTRGWYSLRTEMGTGERKLYRDLTQDRRKIEELCARINKGRVSPIHIDDIIEDFLD